MACSLDSEVTTRRTIEPASAVVPSLASLLSKSHKRDPAMLLAPLWHAPGARVRAALLPTAGLCRPVTVDFPQQVLHRRQDGLLLSAHLCVGTIAKHAAAP